MRLRNALLIAAFILTSFPSLSKENDLWTALDAKIVTDGNPLPWNVYALIQNRSKEFLCIDASDLEKYNTSLMFRDEAGKQVTLERSVEGRMETHHPSFHWDQAYLFFRPQETRKVHLDLSNYFFRGGMYHYDFNFIFFRCADVIDVRKTATAFGGRFQGTIFIKGEK